jgi:hypothetical protein
LTLRTHSSEVAPARAADGEDNEVDLAKPRVINLLSEAKVSMLVKAYVEDTTFKGIFIKLGHDLKALVKVNKETPNQTKPNQNKTNTDSHPYPQQS